MTTEDFSQHRFENLIFTRSDNDLVVTDSLDVGFEKIYSGFFTSTEITEIIALDNNDTEQTYTFEDDIYINATVVSNNYDGTKYNEIIAGSDGNDTIYGASGKDTVYGGLGADTIYGGDGNDHIYDSATTNTKISTKMARIEGGEGDDEINVDITVNDNSVNGYVMIYGDQGKDTINISLVSDTGKTGGANLYIYGDDGEGGDDENDEITISGDFNESDTEINVYGGAGDDIIDVSTVSNVGNGTQINGDSGDDTIYSGQGYNTISGDAGNDTIYAGTTDNHYNTYSYGGTSFGLDVLYNATNNDSFRMLGFSSGNLRFNRCRNDLIVVGNNNSSLTIKDYYTAVSKIDSIRLSDGLTSLATLMETAGVREQFDADLDDLKFTRVANTNTLVVYNTSTSEIMQTYENYFVGTTISGSAPTEFLTRDHSYTPINFTDCNLYVALTGDGDYTGTSFPEVYSGNASVSTFRPSKDSLLFTATTIYTLTSGGLNVQGATGESITLTNYVKGSEPNVYVTYVDESHKDDLGTKTLNIDGFGTYDATTANFNFNSVNIIGTAGNDSYKASEGNDVFDAKTGADSIDFTLTESGNYGDNTVKVNANEILNLTVANGYTYAIDGDNVVLANESVDSNGSVTLTDYAKEQLNVSTVMANGTDLSTLTYNVNMAEPGTYNGKWLKENITGTAGNDIIYGGAGDDTITGGAGVDTIYGGVGADRIISGADKDTLYGGSGIDTFVFSGDFGEDSIADAEATDILEFSDSVHGELNFARVGNDLVITKSEGNAVNVKDYFSGHAVTTYKAKATAEAGVLTSYTLAEDVFIDYVLSNDETFTPDEGFKYNFLIAQGDKATVSGMRSIDKITTADDAVLSRTYGEDETVNGTLVVSDGYASIEIPGFGFDNSLDFLIGEVSTADMTVNVTANVDYSATNYKEVVLVNKNISVTNISNTDKLLFSPGITVYKQTGENSLTISNGTNTVTLSGYNPNTVPAAYVGNFIYNTQDVLSAKILYIDTMSEYDASGVTGFGGVNFTGSAADDTFKSSVGNDVIDAKTGIDNIDFTLTASGNFGNDTVKVNENETLNLTIANGYAHSIDNDDVVLKKSANDEANTVRLTDYAKEQIEGSTVKVNGIDLSSLTYNVTMDEPGIYEGKWLNENITGSEGDDTIYAGKGTDTIKGNGGDDAFVFSKGDGVNTITDISAGDSIVFTDIASGDLSFTKSETGKDIIISAFTQNVSDKVSVTLRDFIDLEPGTSINVQTTDKLLDLKDVVYDVRMTSTTYSGTWLNENIIGTDGNDTITGAKGDDIITGGLGSDKFVFNVSEEKGDGEDVITDAFAGDKIEFTGVEFEDLKFKRIPNSDEELLDLEIDYADSKVIVKDFFVETDFSKRFDSIVIGEETYSILEDADIYVDVYTDYTGFDVIKDGVTVGFKEIIDIYRVDVAVDGSYGNDVIYGTNFPDTLYGGAGDDTIYSGKREDTLSGGEGKDTFVFKTDDGHDTIIDGTSDDTIRYDYTSGFDRLYFTREIGSNDLVIYSNKVNGVYQDSVTLTGFFDAQNPLNKIIMRSLNPSGENVDEEKQIQRDAVINITIPNGGSYAASNYNEKYIIDGNATLIMHNNTGKESRHIFTLTEGAKINLVYDKGNTEVPFSAGCGNATLSEDGTLTLSSSNASGARWGKIVIENYLEYGPNSVTFTNSDDPSMTGLALETIIGNSWVGNTYPFKRTDSVVLTESGEYTGTFISDNIIGSEYVDTIYGAGGNDYIISGDGDDLIYGGTGNDYIDADNGKNIIYGGEGNDTIVSGAGNNTFVYVGNDGHDVIEDAKRGDVLKFDFEMESDPTLSINDNGDGTFDMIVTVDADNTITFKNFNYNANATDIQDNFDDIWIKDSTQPSGYRKIFIYGNNGYAFEKDIERGDTYNKTTLYTERIVVTGLTGEEGLTTITGTTAYDFIKLNGVEKNALSFVRNSDDGLKLYYNNDVVSVADFNYSYGTNVRFIETSDDRINLQNTYIKYFVPEEADFRSPYKFEIPADYNVVSSISNLTSKDRIVFSGTITEFSQTPIAESNNIVFGITDTNKNITVLGYTVAQISNMFGYNSETETNQSIVFENGQTETSVRISDKTLYVTGYSEYTTSENLGVNFANVNITGVADVVNTIYGGIGSDTIYGGEADDKLYGEDGADTIYGGAGSDKIYGGNGSDTLYGEDGADTIYGGVGEDTILGGAGRDVIYGGEDNDTIYSGADNDRLYGGEGNNIFVFQKGDGTDTIQDFKSTDIIKFVGVDFSDMEFSRPELPNNPNQDPEQAPKQSPLLYITYNYVINPETGRGSYADRININNYFDNVNSATTFIVNGVEYSLEWRQSGYDGKYYMYNIVSDPEDIAYGIRNWIEGTEGDDTIYGADRFDTLKGNGGADHIYAGINGAEIYGGTGADTIYGGAGDDAFIFNLGDGADTVIDAKRGDVIKFNDETIKFENLNFARGNGDSTSLFISYSENDVIEIKNYFTYDAEEKNYIMAADAINTFNVGGVDYKLEWHMSNALELSEDVPYEGMYVIQADNSEIMGVEGIPNWINSGKAKDKIYSGNSYDMLAGNEKDDMLVAGKLLEEEAEGAVNIGTAANPIWVQFSTGDVEIYGGEGNDIIYSGSGNDWLMGDADTSAYLEDDEWHIKNGGDDTIYGGAGDDIILGGYYVTNAIGSGDDKLYGGAGNDKIYGGDGDDILYADDGDDKLYGGAGNDILYAGSGKATMSGGNGIDTFVLDSLNVKSIITDGLVGEEILVNDITELKFKFYRQNDDLVISASDEATTTTYPELLKIKEYFVNAPEDRIDTFKKAISYSEETGLYTYQTYSIAEQIDESILYVDADFEDIVFVRDGEKLILAIYGEEQVYSNFFTETNKIETIITRDETEHSIIDEATINVYDVTYYEGYNVQSEDTTWKGYKDKVTASDLGATIYGNYGDDVIYGGAGKDTLQGSEGDDYVYGGVSGQDMLAGDSGNDHLYGGKINADNTITYNTDGVEIYGGSGDDNVFIGGNDESSNFIAGGSGIDLISLNGGNNTICFVNVSEGGAEHTGELLFGEDTISGTTAKDTLKFSVNYSNDPTSPDVVGYRFAELYFKRIDNDLIIIAGGTNKATIKKFFADYDNAVDKIIALDNDGKQQEFSIKENMYVETVVKSGDTYKVSEYRENIVVGIPEEDMVTTIIGAKQNDRISFTNSYENISYERLGSDLMVVDNTTFGGVLLKDFFASSTPIDDINAAGVSHSIFNEAEILVQLYPTIDEYGVYHGATYTTSDYNEKILGSGYDDTVYRSDNEKTIIYGEGLNDTIYAGTLNEDGTINWNTKDAVFDGGVGDDVIYGGSGNDYLDANEGNDLLFGGAGNDILVAGIDSTVMTGGVGNDTFRLSDLNVKVTITDGSNIAGVEVDHIEINNTTITDFIYERHSDNLVISAVSGVITYTELLTIKDYYSSDAPIETLKVATSYDPVTDTYTYKEISLSEKAGDLELQTDVDFEFLKFTRVGDNLVITSEFLTESMLLKNFFNGNMVETIYTNGVAHSIVDEAKIYVNHISSYEGYDVPAQAKGFAEIITTSNEDSYIKGNMADDEIYGGAGNDTLYGGAGNDIIYGGVSGKDYINGESGNDKLIAGALSTNGKTIIYNSENVELYGGAGEDTIYSGAGSDYIVGGSGNDIVYLNGGSNEIVLTESDFGEDVVYYATSIDKLCFAIQYVDGNNNVIKKGYSFSDLSFQQVDNDLVISAAADSGVVNKVTIKNYYSSSSRLDKVVAFNEDGNIETDSILEIIPVARTYTVKKHVITATPYADIIKGEDKQKNTIYANGGNDVVTAGRGNDKLYGGLGRNEFIFNIGDGKDTIYADGGRDTLTINGITSAQDIVISSKKNDVIIKYSSKDQITVKDYFKADSNGMYKRSVVKINLPDVTDGSESSIDLNEYITNPNRRYIDLAELGKKSYTGTAFAETIVGTSAKNTIKGGGGCDVINLTAGGDNSVYTQSKVQEKATVITGNGKDTLNAGKGIDTFVFADGTCNDTVVANSANNANAVLDLRNLSSVKYAESGSNLVITNTYNSGNTETITIKNYLKNKLTNNVSVLAGDMTNAQNLHTYLSTLQAADPSTLKLGDSTSEKKQTVKGTFLDESLVGGSANDTLTSNGGKDKLIGGKGNDTLNGYIAKVNKVYQYDDVNNAMIYTFDADGDGKDTIKSAKIADRIVFNADSVQAVNDFELTQSKSKNSLILTYAGDNTITITDYYKLNATTQAIRYVDVVYGGIVRTIDLASPSTIAAANTGINSISLSKVDEVQSEVASWLGTTSSDVGVITQTEDNQASVAELVAAYTKYDSFA